MNSPNTTTNTRHHKQLNFTEHSIIYKFKFIDYKNKRVWRNYEIVSPHSLVVMILLLSNHSITISIIHIFI